MNDIFESLKNYVLVCEVINFYSHTWQSIIHWILTRQSSKFQAVQLLPWGSPDMRSKVLALLCILFLLQGCLWKIITMPCHILENTQPQNLTFCPNMISENFLVLIFKHLRLYLHWTLTYFIILSCWKLICIFLGLSRPARPGSRGQLKFKWDPDCRLFGKF